MTYPKTIELHGGPGHGKRFTVKAGVSLNLLSLSNPVGFGFGYVEYRHSGAHTSDGLEIWTPGGRPIDQLAEVLDLARQCAEWHVQDGDQCGRIARRLIETIDALKGTASPTPR